MTATEVASTSQQDAPRRSPWRYVVLGVIVLFAAFWIWALFFASKEAANKVGDRAWAARAQQICAQAKADRLAMADLRQIDPDDRVMLTERAGLVDQATGIVERMLDDVVTVAPNDPKGQAIVPRWTADYRTYIADRRVYAGVLRAGSNPPFAETAVDGIPISDKLTVFAGDNRMPDCAPPTDLG